MKKFCRAAIMMMLIIPAVAVTGNHCMARVDLPVSPLYGPIELAVNDNIQMKEFEVPSDSPTAPAPDQKKISKSKAVFLSLLMPGAGHFYLDEKGRGEVFVGTEIVSWAGAAAFQIYGKWKEDDYIDYAVKHAGIDPAGKSEDFYKNLTFYDSRMDYNTAGRVIDPGDPYYPNTSAYYWDWENDASRSFYRGMRNDSETAFRNRDFMIGVAIFNRIIAGIDAFRLARKKIHSRVDQFGGGLGKDVKLAFKANPFGNNPKVEIKLSRRF
ncbi:MAG: hypothetical protein AB1746_09355 [Candidatus Zixiibacteriota bacterium]